MLSALCWEGAVRSSRKKSARQTLWITHELCAFLPQIDDQTDEIGSYQLTVGTKTCPVGVVARHPAVHPYYRGVRSLVVVVSCGGSHVTMPEKTQETLTSTR